MTLSPCCFTDVHHHFMAHCSQLCFILFFSQNFICSPNWSQTNRNPCLSFPSTGVIGMNYHAQEPFISPENKACQIWGCLVGNRVHLGVLIQKLGTSHFFPYLCKFLFNVSFVSRHKDFFNQEMAITRSII